MVPGAVTQRGTLVLGDQPAKGLVATSGVRESGVQRHLICLPTTSGKMAVFAQLVRQGRRRGLVLAHREEFVTHHVSKLHEVDPTISVGIALRRRWHGVVPRVLAGAETVYILLRGGQPQWPGLSEDRYFPPIPGGQVALKRDAERWRAFSFRDNKTGALEDDLELTSARGVVEDHTRPVGAAWLADPLARWREASPSAARMRRLHRFGIVTPAGCTRGQASDLITAGQARREAADHPVEAVG